MNTPFLNKHNIFSIPVGTNFDSDNESLQLIYSPFTENMLIVTSDYVSMMEDRIRLDNTGSDEMAVLLDSLIPGNDYRSIIEKNVDRKTFNTLSILPNNICNFSCSYCYSSQGRSGKKLTKEEIDTALADFINPRRTELRKLYISIFGGGEPMMTPQLTRYIIEHAHELAREHGFILRISMVTNGSLIDDEILELLKKHSITVTVSFEILKEIQNLQRAHYDIVDKNITRMLEAGVDVRIRATITFENVHLQHEMVKKVIERYPGVEDIMMEEVTDGALSEDLVKMREFYRTFLENFNKACELGEKHGKNVDCSSFRNMNILIDRFCPGELCLTPEGEYSICSRMTSPLDIGYQSSIYGKISDGEVLIDDDKLAQLVNVNVFSKEKCSNCFTRWHCGGGCYAQQFVYTDEAMNIICDYKREFTKQQLLKALDHEYRELHGISLKEFINTAAND